MGKSKVAFVRPPNLQKSEAWAKQGVIRCPLNLCLLISFLRERGNLECTLIDFEITPARNLSHMVEIVLKDDPQYVCFTTLTPRYPTVVKLAQELHRVSRGIVNIVGGPHVTGATEYSMFDGVDYGIIGEGEEALLELLTTLDAGRDTSHIGNLVYRVDGRVKINKPRPFIKNLDSMPFPAWDLMTFDEYTDPAYFKGAHLAIFSTRGCPHDCNFCASCVTWKRKMRFRSVENVIDEIRHIVNVLNIHNLMFWDDSFAIDRQRAVKICTELIKEDIKVNYTVQIRADTLTEELAHVLKDSGCCFAAIGVESGNEEILKQIGKNETKSQFRNAVGIMKKAGLPAIASFIIGHPGDTHETIKETIDFAFELNADQSKFMILSPYPGTMVYEIARQKGLTDPLSFEQMEATNYYDSVSINLSEVTDEDLLRYQDEAYKRFDLSQTK